MSVNQRLTSHSLIVRKQSLINEKRTTKISGFVQKKELLELQIKIAKERANRFCPIFDPTNYYWQQLEKLEDVAINSLF